MYLFIIKTTEILKVMMKLVFFFYFLFTDLKLTSNRFVDENVTTFSQFLFDVSGKQMIVGAR